MGTRGRGRAGVGQKSSWQVNGRGLSRGVGNTGEVQEYESGTHSGKTELRHRKASSVSPGHKTGTNEESLKC